MHWFGRYLKEITFCKENDFLISTHYEITHDDFEDLLLFISPSFIVWVDASELCPVWIATLLAVFCLLEAYDKLTSLVLFGLIWVDVHAVFTPLFLVNEGDDKSSMQSLKSSSAYAIESCLLKRKNLSDVIANEIMMHLNYKRMEIMPQIIHKLP